MTAFDRFRVLSQRCVGHVWFELVIFLLILLSLVLLGEDYLIPLHSAERQQLELAQFTVTLAFCLELLMRWSASSDTTSFWRECWLDVLAILPGLRVFKIGGAFRLLRLLRLVRLLRLMGGRTTLQSGSRLARLAESAMVTAILWIALLGGTFGLAGYETEFHYSLENLVDAFWRSLFSFFSAQYVEQFPHSVGAKVVALFIIVSGSGFFALITGMTSAIVSEKLREGNRALSDYLLKQLSGHVVVCGWNSGGLAALRELQANPHFAERDMIVISDREEIAELRTLPFPARVRLLRDDFTRILALQRANVQQASVALILTDTHNGRSQQDADARVVLAALTIEKLNPNVHSCAEIASAEVEQHLRMGKIDEVVVSGEVSGSLLAQAAISSTGCRILRDMLNPAAGCQLNGRTVGPDDVGRTFSELLTCWHSRDGANPVAVAVGGEAGRLLINPRNYRVQEGDMVYCVEGSSEL